MGVSSFFSRKETVVDRSISPSLINRIMVYSELLLLPVVAIGCIQRQTIVLHPTDRQRRGFIVISLYLDLFIYFPQETIKLAD